MKDYPFNLTPLGKEDGGGWLITFPDLPGCMSDGETIEEAIENGKDAAQLWLNTNAVLGRSVPKFSFPPTR